MSKFEILKLSLFSVESCLKCCDVKGEGGGGGGGVNVNFIMMLIFPQGLWTSPLSKGYIAPDEII